MTLRPHLVLDGAVLAARSVEAQRVVLYIGGAHLQARRAMEHALRERAGSDGVDVQVCAAPQRYISGEETAAVRFVNEGTALPIGIGLRPFERGVDARPTLVQNVESLAQAAMIARRGADWFHSLGSPGAAGTVLVTVGGGVLQSGVLEVAAGTRVGDAIEAAGGRLDASSAVLLGGYFGGWLHAERAWSLPLEPQRLQQHGAALGCGVIAVLPAQQCGVAHTASIMRWLAAESARQCGPCVFGLGAIAATATRIVHGGAADDLLLLRRWSGELRGRGGCRHPDGAAQLMRTALQTFADDYQTHLRTGRCLVQSTSARAA